MELTTLAKVKALMGYTGTSEDVALTQLVTSVSDRVSRALRRETEAAERTETTRLVRTGKTVTLCAFPVTAVASVKFSSTGDFTDIDALVEFEDYSVDLEQGTITLSVSTSGKFPTAQVVYTGGMATDTATFITDYAGLSAAVDMQIQLEAKRRQTVGSTSQRTSGGDIRYEGELDFFKGLMRQIVFHQRMVW